MAGTPASSRATSGLLTELFDSTLGAPAAAIDTGAGGFAATFDHLLISTLLRTTEASTISAALITFNNDAAGNYDEQRVSGRSGAASAASTAAAANWTLGCAGANMAAGVFGAGLAWIPGYAQTVAEKGVIYILGVANEVAANSTAETRTAHWRSTAAITRLIFTANAGADFVTGSRVTVYGVG